MTLSKDIAKYFDEYIKNYTPYKNYKFYNAIVEYIKSNLMQFIYNDNPKEFKSLYENNLVPPEVTHTLLIQLGVPADILNKLSISDQIIFLQSLSDFFRYKGSIDFFTKVGKVFSDDFEIYELYIDFDSVNGWVLKPIKIIGDSDFHDTIDYSQVYNSIPSTLISEEQLTEYYNNNQLILPLKSNLLLLKYHFIQEVNSFFNLIVSTFMKDYGSNEFNIYFLNNSFSVSLNEFVYIWFYIILRLYDGVWPEYELRKLNILLLIFNPYNMSDIDALFTEYQEIDNANDALAFFNDNIQLYFNYAYYTSEMSVSDMELNIDFQILDYLNDRINSMNPNFIKAEYHQILNELLNSFSLYSYTQTDPMYIKYYDYFINFLPQIILDPKETKSYLILDNFKPFHTELITQQVQYIKSQSKFDLVTPKILYNFAIKLSKIDACSIIDIYNFSIKHAILDNSTMIEQILYQICYLYSSIVDISEETKLMYKLYYASLLDMNDVNQFKYKFNDNGVNTFSLNELIILNHKLQEYLNIDINEEIKNVINFDIYSLLNINDINQFKYKFSDNGINAFSLNEFIKLEYSQFKKYLNFNMNEVNNKIYLYNNTDMLNLGENFNIID